MNTYEVILDILKDAKIKNINALSKLKTTYINNFPVKYVMAGDYPWIADIVKLVLNDYNDIFMTFKNKNSHLFAIETFYSSYFYHSWDTTDRIFEIKSKYSCLFPYRVLYQSVQFVYYTDWEGKASGVNYGVPIDFFILLFHLKPALMSGIALLLPTRVCLKGPPNMTLATCYYDVRKNDVFIINQDGFGFNDLQIVAEENSTINVDGFVLNTHWLHNARIDDYVETIQSHENEYIKYSHTIDKYLNKEIVTEQDLKMWLEELKYNIADLNILYQNKQKELTRKGIQISFGIVLTAGLLLLPDELSYMKPSLLALSSSKTISDGVQYINDVRQCKDLLNNNDYWLLWKNATE